MDVDVNYSESLSNGSFENVSIPSEGDYYYEDIHNLQKPWWTKEPHFLPLVIIYGTVFLFGIVGNSIVIFSVVGRRSALSVTFTFMVSLAISDLLFLLVVVPNETLRMILGGWTGGRVVCKLSAFIEMLTAVASILNLTAVSFERYFVIVMPMQSRRRCTLGNTRRVLIIVWTVSVCLSAPALYIKDTETTTYFNQNTSVSMVFCADHGLADSQRIHYAIYQLLVMFVIPTIMMIYCYTVVICVLWASGKTLMNLTSTNGSSVVSSHDGLTYSIRSNKTGQYRRRYFLQFCTNPPQSDANQSIIKGRKQVIKMLITVILVFLFSWGPKLVFQVFKYSDYKDHMHTHFHFRLQIGIYCLPYIQSCLNPVIYGIMSKNFRKFVMTSCNMKTITCHCGQRSSTNSDFEMETKLTNGTILKTARNSGSGSAEI